ncbi:MAG: hypothetical protein R3279_03240 [Putridiphycobacter sp.]|nr:hypothetical protein [Putridiphycobacter sp.]
MNRVSSTIISLKSLKTISSKLNGSDFLYSDYLDFIDLLVKTKTVLSTLPEFQSNMAFQRSIKSIPELKTISSDNLWQNSIMYWIILTVFLPAFGTGMFYVFKYMGFNWFVLALTIYILITVIIVSLKIKNFKKRKAILDDIREAEIVIGHLLIHFKEPKYLQSIEEKRAILNRMKTAYNKK